MQLARQPATVLQHGDLGPRRPVLVQLAARPDEEQEVATGAEQVAGVERVAHDVTRGPR